MSLVRKLILKIAYRRPREYARPQSLVSLRDPPSLMADTAEAARLAKRRLEELSRKVVTPNTRAVREVFGHRLIGVPGLLPGREMAVSTLNFDVLFLVVRKTPVAGSVFRLRERKKFSLFSAR